MIDPDKLMAADRRVQDFLDAHDMVTRHGSTREQRAKAQAQRIMLVTDLARTL